MPVILRNLFKISRAVGSKCLLRLYVFAHNSKTLPQAVVNITCKSESLYCAMRKLIKIQCSQGICFQSRTLMLAIDGDIDNLAYTVFIVVLHTVLCNVGLIFIGPILQKEISDISVRIMALISYNIDVKMEWSFSVISLLRRQFKWWDYKSHKKLKRLLIHSPNLR